MTNVLTGEGTEPRVHRAAHRQPELRDLKAEIRRVLRVDQQRREKRRGVVVHLLLRGDLHPEQKLISRRIGLGSDHASAAPRGLPRAQGEVVSPHEVRVFGDERHEISVAGADRPVKRRAFVCQHSKLSG